MDSFGFNKPALVLMPWLEVVPMTDLTRRGSLAFIACVIGCTVFSGCSLGPGSKQTSGQGQSVKTAEQPAPKVVLNHAYLVVDEKTYRDIAASDFLNNEFAGFAKRTTKTGEGRTWSGTYLYGERTYLEFFPPGALDTSETCGIGFGVEESDGIKVVRERLARLAGKPVELTLKTRLRDQHKIPWFYVTGLPAVSGATLETWVMEYHPEYLPTWNPVFPAGADPLSRRAYLADRYKPDRLLQEIFGLTVALEEDEGKRLRDQLVALGYAVSPIAGGHLARGAGLEIVFLPATAEASGIIDVRMTLNRPKSGAKEYRFGPRSVLRFRDDKTASWTFQRVPDR